MYGNVCGVQVHACVVEEIPAVSCATFRPYISKCAEPTNCLLLDADILLIQFLGSLSLEGQELLHLVTATERYKGECFALRAVGATPRTRLSNFIFNSVFFDCSALQSNCSDWFSSIAACKMQRELLKWVARRPRVNWVKPDWSYWRWTSFVRTWLTFLAALWSTFQVPCILWSNTTFERTSGSLYPHIYLLFLRASSASFAFKESVISHTLSAYSLFFLMASMSSFWNALWSQAPVPTEPVLGGGGGEAHLLL